MATTPGPWATSNDGVPEAFRPQITVYAEADGGRVATVFREEANARLIAAAPDLLAACEAAQGALIALTTGAGSPTPAVVEGRAALQAVNAALAAARD